MWILIRLVAAFIAFAIRARRRSSLPSPEGEVDGVPYSVVRTTRKGRTLATKIGIRMSTGVVMHFARETAIHRIMKSIGFATEVQTSDHAFDRNVYVTCDHPDLTDRLKIDAEFRRNLAKILSDGAKSIWSDGRVLWCRFKGAYDQPARSAQDLLAIARRIGEFPSHLVDDFFVRALIIEGIAWSLAVYGILGTMDHMMTTSDIFVDGGDVVYAGLGVAAGLGVLLALVIRLVLGRSSRAPKLVIEYGIVLLIALPVVGPVMVSDIDRAFDKGDAVVAERLIKKAWMQEHRGKRGRRTYTYHATLSSAGDEMPPIPIASRVAIDKTMYEAVRDGSKLRFAVRPGRLGYPWYEKIDVVGP